MNCRPTPCDLTRREPWQRHDPLVAKSLEGISAKPRCWTASGTIPARRDTPPPRCHRGQRPQTPNPRGAKPARTSTSPKRDFAPLRGAGSGGGSTSGAETAPPQKSETRPAARTGRCKRQLAHTPPASDSRPAAPCTRRRRPAHRRRAEISGLVADSRNRATRNGTPSTRPRHEWMLAPGDVTSRRCDLDATPPM